MALRYQSCFPATSGRGYLFYYLGDSMYVHRVEFCGPAALPQEKIVDFANNYLAALRMNGQICGSEWPIYIQDDRCVASVLTPTHQSLDHQYHGKYVKEKVCEAKTQAIAISSSLIAKDYDSAEVCTCHNPSGYILFTTYLSLESPVRCFDCFLPVPLYHLPAMPSGDYHELICWQSDYQSCDRLQMNCRILEKATTRQLSDFTSELSKAGKENCSVLTLLSGKPVYYYLYRAHGRSAGSEKKRICPSCGQPWYRETRLHSLFHYKCDQCRLLSNFAWNLSP